MSRKSIGALGGVAGMVAAIAIWPFDMISAGGIAIVAIFFADLLRQETKRTPLWEILPALLIVAACAQALVLWWPHLLAAATGVS